MPEPTKVGTASSGVLPRSDHYRSQRSNCRHCRPKNDPFVCQTDNFSAFQEELEKGACVTPRTRICP